MKIEKIHPETLKYAGYEIMPLFKKSNHVLEEWMYSKNTIDGFPRFHIEHITNHTTYFGDKLKAGWHIHYDAKRFHGLDKDNMNIITKGSLIQNEIYRIAIFNRKRKILAQLNEIENLKHNIEVNKLKLLNNKQ